MQPSCQLAGLLVALPRHAFMPRFTKLPPPDAAAAGHDEPRFLLSLITILANTLICGLLIRAAVLRETPAFWTNAGGYPVLVRAAVRWFFIPGLGVGAVGVALGMWQALSLWKSIGRGASVLLIVCLGHAVALEVAAIIALCE